MSRAIGKDTAALLHGGDPETAYREISQALTEPTCAELLEIEILGRGYPIAPGTNLLRDGNAIAIPKLSLLLAFTVARQILKRHQEKDPDTSPAAALAATAVILLMDPEHLTAANTRKRLLQRQVAVESHGLVLVDEEKRLVDSILTSRLHRHTKSPTLWHHRRWLLEFATSRGLLRLDVAADITDVVMVAGERHPRNYYAWHHARWLVQVSRGAGGRGEGSDNDDEAEREKILSATKDWCYRHHTDISGWSFLYFLLFNCGPSSAEVCASTLAEVARLVASFRWTNESVWVLWRTAVSSGTVGPAAYREFLQTNHTLQDTAPNDSPEQKVLQRAEEWAAANRGAG